MAITFEVSKVARATAPLRIPEGDPPRALQGLPVEAMGAGHGPWLPTAGNAFLRAVHAAYALHYPLSLSPDAVWLCIAQGFAAHVNANAEHLRTKFVRHEGQVTLIVRRDDFVKGSPENPWPEVFHAFSDGVAEHIGRQRDLLVCDFSTTGPIERAASEIVLFDAMQRFFRFEVHTLCGIPEITLEGTADDWRAIRRRARALEEYDTAFWMGELGPVLDEFIAAAEGRVDRRFWETFFKHADGSGGPWVRGWINVLFPYVRDAHHPERLTRNRSLGAWRDELDVIFGGGPSPSSIPSGLSSVPFVWEYLGQRIPMRFLGGFTGIAQAAASLAIRPVIGWAVRDDTPSLSPPSEAERFEAWRARRENVPRGAHVIAGWLSGSRWLTLAEIEAAGAQIEQIGAEHGVTLSWAIGGDLGNAGEFPEAPLPVRFAVGAHLASVHMLQKAAVSVAATLCALQQAQSTPAALREALAAVVPGGLEGDPSIHVLVAGSQLRGTLVHDATGATLAEVHTGGAAVASVDLRPGFTLSAAWDAPSR